MASINSINNIIPAANFTISAGNLVLPNTNVGGTEGEITVGGTLYFNNFGSGGSNTFLGPNAGRLNVLNTGGANNGVGAGVFNFISSGTSNCSFGHVTMQAVAAGSNNSAYGAGALYINDGGNNTAVGYQAAAQVQTANSLIALGYQAGYNWTAGNSNNIAIGNAGTNGDSGVIRIGTSGTHTTTNIVGPTMNLATDAVAGTITIGNVTSTTAVNINTGTNGSTITTTNGILTANTGTGVISLSTDAAATTVNLATGGAAKTVALGSTNTTSGTTINSGSNGVKLIGVASVAVANKNYVTINTSTGALGSDNAPLSSISITGDSGGALSGSAFTFTGGTTGLTFAGAGTTETLGGTLVVSNGGTGAVTLTGVLTGNGTSAVTANAVTQHGVLLGGATNAVSSLGVAATGTVLAGVTSSDPAFTATPGVTSITFGAGSALSTFVDWTSWTPTFDGATPGTTTYTLQDGLYSRIGNIVVIHFRISITAATGTGNATVGGLPFTINNSDANYVPQGVVRVSSTVMTWPAGTTMLTLQGGNNTTTATILGTGSGVVTANLQMANTSAVIIGSLTYRV